MTKTIKSVVAVIATLAVVAIAWTFILGPGGVAQTVGASAMTKVDDVFDSIGLDTDLAGMYETAFDEQDTQDVVY